LYYKFVLNTWLFRAKVQNGTRYCTLRPISDNKIFIDVDEIDTMNLRTLHDLTSTHFNTIQFLQHLKLLPTKPRTGESCPKKCNDWYLAYSQNRGDEGLFLQKKASISFILYIGYVFRCRKCKMVRSSPNSSYDYVKYSNLCIFGQDKMMQFKMLYMN